MGSAKLTWDRDNASETDNELINQATLASGVSVSSSSVDLGGDGINTCMVQLECTLDGTEDGDPKLEILSSVKDISITAAQEKADTEAFDSLTIDRTVGAGTVRKTLQIVNIPRFIAKVTNQATATAITNVIVRIAKGKWES